MVVFYYGYGCSHCVAQLFAINEELEKFKAAGAKVVAVSSDSSDHTAGKFREYGRFDFDVVADVDNAVATRWGCYRAATGSVEEDRQHGTFVIDREGIVRWANTGYEPFIDNASLLATCSGRSEGRRRDQRGREDEGHPPALKHRRGVVFDVACFLQTKARRRDRVL